MNSGSFRKKAESKRSGRFRICIFCSFLKFHYLALAIVEVSESLPTVYCIILERINNKIFQMIRQEPQPSPHALLNFITSICLKIINVSDFANHRAFHLFWREWTGDKGTGGIKRAHRNPIKVSYVLYAPRARREAKLPLRPAFSLFIFSSLLSQRDV